MVRRLGVCGRCSDKRRSLGLGGVRIYEPLWPNGLCAEHHHLARAERKIAQLERTDTFLGDVRSALYAWLRRTRDDPNHRGRLSIAEPDPTGALSTADPSAGTGALTRVDETGTPDHSFVREQSPATSGRHPPGGRLRAFVEKLREIFLRRARRA